MRRSTGGGCSSSSSSRSDAKRASPRRLSVAGSGGAPRLLGHRDDTVTRPRRIANTTTTTTSAAREQGPEQQEVKVRDLGAAPQDTLDGCEVQGNEIERPHVLEERVRQRDLVDADEAAHRHEEEHELDRHGLEPVAVEARRRALTPKSTANHAAMRTTVATSWSASCP